MSTRKIVEIVAMSLAVLVLIAMFIPYASGGSENFWKYSELLFNDKNHIFGIMMIVGLLASAICLLLHVLGVMKDSKESYIGAGFVGLLTLTEFINIADGSLDGVGIGFWLLSLCGPAFLVLTVVAQFLSDEAKPKYGYGYNQYGQPNGYNPMGYQNPQGGYPQQGGYNPQGPMYR